MLTGVGGPLSAPDIGRYLSYNLQNTWRTTKMSTQRKINVKREALKQPSSKYLDISRVPPQARPVKVDILVTNPSCRCNLTMSPVHFKTAQAPLRSVLQSARKARIADAIALPNINHEFSLVALEKPDVALAAG
jgi:hypothetical protein